MADKRISYIRNSKLELFKKQFIEKRYNLKYDKRKEEEGLNDTNQRKGG